MSRLRVAIGVVGGVTGGPARYGIELVRSLSRRVEAGIPPDLEVWALTDRPEVFEGLPGVRAVHLPLPSSWAQPWWDNVAVPRALRRLQPDVYHGTKHALPLAGTPRATATVASIHDLAVLAEPETFGRAQRAQLLVHLRHAARSATRILCGSHHAAGDVAARLGVAPERISVVLYGVGEEFVPPADESARIAVRRRLGVDRGALVSFVGTAQPRKRIEVAIEAVARLRAQGRPVVLAIAGRRRPGYEPAWAKNPPPFVRLLGEVDGPSLVDLYGASDVMVSPSTFEGFGFTFVEAMACGCPVVGVAATSVPEVVADGGILVAAADPERIAGALARLVGDPALREATSRAALRRARQLSWERCAEGTLDVYLAAAGREPPSPGARPT
jgi:alpha-1,3-rhamnosyl/mannosyltransferase